MKGRNKTSDPLLAVVYFMRVTDGELEPFPDGAMMDSLINKDIVTSLKEAQRIAKIDGVSSVLVGGWPLMKNGGAIVVVSKDSGIDSDIESIMKAQGILRRKVPPGVDWQCVYIVPRDITIDRATELPISTANAAPLH